MTRQKPPSWKVKQVLPEHVPGVKIIISLADWPEYQRVNDLKATGRMAEPLKPDEFMPGVIVLVERKGETNA